MKRSIALGLGALLVVGACSAALAEPETGSRIDQAPGSVRSDDMEGKNAAMRVMNRFARCIAKQRQKGAENLLTLPYLSPEQERAARGLVGGDENCMGMGNRELAFQPAALMGGVAEGLVVQRYAKLDAATLRPLTEQVVATAGLNPRNTAEDFAQCVVLRDPSSVFSLIETEPASTAEAAWVKKLAPQLGPCLVQGQTISLNSASVRSVVAVGLYRLMPLLASQTASAK